VAVFNTIIPGMPWQQTFRFPAGAVALDEFMRASFRKNAASPLIFAVNEPGEIVRDGNDFTVFLTANQTDQLEGVSRVSFDLYAFKGAAVRPLQLRVHVPVRVGL
jgi:hypothetical protein